MKTFHSPSNRSKILVSFLFQPFPGPRTLKKIHDAHVRFINLKRNLPILSQVNKKVLPTKPTFNFSQFMDFKSGSQIRQILRNSIQFQSSDTGGMSRETSYKSHLIHLNLLSISLLFQLFDIIFLH